MKKLLLLIDDDTTLHKWLAQALPENLFIIVTALTGREGLELAFQRKPDLILLEWNLPGMSGLEVCKSLKENPATTHTPLIMLTSYAQVQRKITAFDRGADDYITKPFQIEELVARTKAVLRRCGDAPDEVLRHTGITMNLTTYEVDVDKKPLKLTATEFSLLHMLMSSPGRLLTRKHLLEHIWGYAVDVSTRTVDVYIRRLRKKLGLKRAACIESVHCLGYKFAGVPRSPQPLLGLISLEKVGAAAQGQRREAISVLS